MFLRRHGWAVALASTIGAAASYWLAPDISNLPTGRLVKLLIHSGVIIFALSLLYLLVASIEGEARKDFEAEHAAQIAASNRLEISSLELSRCRQECEGAKLELREKLQRVESQALSSTSGKGAQIKSLNSAWLKSVEVRPVPEYRFDPIHGAILIDEKLLRIFRQPIVQRLNYVRQLSFSYLTFPTATHCRLAHSLGVCKMAELALTGMFLRNQVFTADSPTPEPLDAALTPGEQKDLLLKCRISGLLHDLGHGPFGHALDQFVGFHDHASIKLQPDKEYSIRYIKELMSEPLNAIGVDDAAITRLLEKSVRRSLSGYDPLIADLIDSPLDVDRIDYLFRDGVMTGLTSGYGSLRTLLEMMRPFRSGDAVSLAFDESAVPAIENLLYLRDFMYVNCYEVPAKLSAERAFQRIADELVSNHLLTVDELMLLTDDTVLGVALGLAESNPVVNGLTRSLRTGQGYEQVFSCRPSISENAEVANWVQNKLLGNVGGGLTQAYIVLPKLWERRIADEAGIGVQRSWQVLVCVPSYFAYVQKESGARILVKSQSGGWQTVDLFEYSEKLGLILEQMRPASTCIRVFASAALTDDENLRVRSSSQSLLG
jgi:HD superfamily phosphohydrolase